MARFGQGLIQALTNPSYADSLSKAGMMAGAAPGLLRTREEEKAKEEQARQAQAAIFAQMNQSNVNDPTVASQILNQGVAAGLDPEKLQEQIRKTQTSQRGQENLRLSEEAGVRSEEQLRIQQEGLEIRRAEALYRKADQEWQMEQRQIQEDQKSITNAIESAVVAGSDMDKVLLQVPSEYRAFAREQIADLKEFKADEVERLAKAAALEPLTDSDLEVYREVVGDDAIKAYKVQAGKEGDAPKTARVRLENLYSDVLKSRLTAKNSDKTESMKVPTEKDVKRAAAAVNSTFSGAGLRGWRGRGREALLSSDERKMFSQAVAAKAKTNPEWLLTEENLKDYWEYIKEENKIGVEKTEVQGNVSDVVDSPKSIDDMNEDELEAYLTENSPEAYE